jgi:D-aspartate ligase
MAATLHSPERAVSVPHSSSNIGALVIGGAHGSLAVVRSLGRQGIPVHLLIDDHPIAKFSRYVTSSSTWRGPNDSGAAEHLLSLGLDGWVLYPGGDAEAQFISKHHEKLSCVFRVTTPPWDVVRWAVDKRLTYDLAAELGIDHPWSCYPENREEVAHLQCRFPLILKPTVRQHANAFTAAKAWRVDDRAELLARYDQAVALVGRDGLVIQEMIPGNGATQFSYAAVWDDQRPLASLVARRARQYPITFGYTSTFVESIHLPQIEDAAARFLRAIHYRGLVEIEFKYDAREDRYKLLDVNARTWTWNALGRRAGVDFPHILWKLAMGEMMAPARGRAGVAWMHASRDVIAAAQEICAGTLSPLAYLKSLCAPMTFAAFAPDDPVPGLIDFPLTVRRSFHRPRA